MTAGLAPLFELESDLRLESEVDWEIGGGWTGVLAPLVGGVTALGVSTVSCLLASFATLSPGEPPDPLELVFDSEPATVDARTFTLGLRYDGITNPGLSPGSCVACWPRFLGGHSFFSLTSTVDASPTELVWDTTLELRDETE